MWAPCCVLARAKLQLHRETYGSATREASIWRWYSRDLGSGFCFSGDGLGLMCALVSRLARTLADMMSMCMCSVNNYLDVVVWWSVQAQVRRLVKYAGDLIATVSATCRKLVEVACIRTVGREQLLKQRLGVLIVTLWRKT